MQLSTAAVATPHYALLGDENLLQGPLCKTIEGNLCKAIYGFNNREAYDRFRNSGQSTWRPYPLVRRHLEQMLAQPALQLVVLDASGPDEPSLVAGTAEAVLSAQINGETQLKIGFYLTQSLDGQAYLVERAPQ